MTTSLAPIWQLHPHHAPEPALALADALGAPAAVGHVLHHRGITDPDVARRFLLPSLDDLLDPAPLLDLAPAVARLRSAIAAGEPIRVHGDYDVDGVTATFLIVSVLRDLGARVDHRIPHRTRDGYGLSVAAVEQAASDGCRVIVTVDCGITALEAAARARALDIDLIITDHHEPAARLPHAFAILNPRRPGCPYPFKSLAGVGVAFKLAHALLEGHGGLARAAAFLDVVALGTIADVVPLVGENRTLAWLGLERLQGARRPGLEALVDCTGLAGRRVTDTHIAFVLAPRLNAAGRVGHADQALGLLFARDVPEGRAFADTLEEENTRRRELDERVLREAAERVTTELAWPACRSIVLWSEHWHPGVLGIVASRLVERFHRPAVLIGLDGATGRGSGRSAGGLDLNGVLDACGDLLESWGGHAFAAGLSVRRERLGELRQRFEQLVAERLALDDCVPRVSVDADLPLDAVDLRLVEWLERVAPHGLGNPAPVFRARVHVDVAQWVGDGRHLRLAVSDATGAAEAIGFRFSDRIHEPVRRGPHEILFVPFRSEWLGETRLQLRLKGIRAA
jgi:single-stranded-DNA-specific exonuclease